LLTLRRNLKRKFLDIENSIRHSLKSFGIRLAGTTRGHFADVIRGVIADDPLLQAMIEPMLEVRASMWMQYTKLHRLVIRVVRADEVCRRFMAIPGVGPVTALQVKTALDDPGRFSRSKTVGAYFGLTSRRWQTGTSLDIQGRISKMGDDDVRRALVEAANSLLLRYQGWSALKVWGLKISKTRGRKRALVAVARKLAGSCSRCGATAPSTALGRRRTRPSQRDFWLGRKASATPSDIRARYGALKPCLHGSDAHETDKVGVADDERYSGSRAPPSSIHSANR